MSRIASFEPHSKETQVADWVRRRLGSVDHELRVARVAKTLFNLTRRWHNLSSADSRVLTLAALVHDVGRAMGPRKHAKNGARMVLESSSLPLTPTERRRVAFLARHHKGRIQETALLHDTLDDPKAMHILLALLRAADGLDSRKLGGLRLVITLRGRDLTIYGHPDSGTPTTASHLEAIYGRRKKFQLLEQSLNCRIHTQWFGTGEMGLVG
jgi:exopolyphosphatase/pppGpp-phosphohydrolase